jgi:hypothetical protein
MRLTIKLPARKAKYFANHLRKEHPKYSRSLKVSKK